METDPLPSFAVLLRGFRVARGLSQEALAERAGVSREAISLLERGLRLSPRRDTVFLLSKTLKLSADERSRLLAAADERHGRAAAATSLASGPSSSLPARLTSFVGRAREIVEVQELLSATRLLTLVGSGGIGKTSLALTVAAAAQAQFADGVALVELAALTDGDQVPPTLASVLGIREQRGEPILTTVGRVLKLSHRLLVLDNCEHLVEACGRVAETLLQVCPRLQVLVTSREPLRVGAEVIWRVPSLTLPVGDDQPLDVVVRSEAVRLFVERASAMRPGFELSVENTPAVVEICRRLDGIPLAIELAAARMAELTPEVMARHLHDRFRLLTTGSRTALPRHQTLRALIDWSHELLTEKERITFRRLAVFVGGWSLEAAEAVCGSTRELDGDQESNVVISREDVLDLLVGLVDKSLLLVEDGDSDTRFSMLETIREYAVDHLVASGEASDLYHRHANWALTFAETGRSIDVTEANFQLWLARLGQDYENLRAALQLLRESGDIARAVRLTKVLWVFWSARGHYREGKTESDACLALLGESDYPEERAWLRLCSGEMTYMLGDLVAAQPYFGPTVDYWREVGNLPRLSAALNGLGMILLGQGDAGQALPIFEESVATSREVGDRESIARSLLFLGIATSANDDLVRARALLEESLVIGREAGADDVVVADIQMSLGIVLEDLGENAHAESLYRKTMTMTSAGGIRRAIAFGLEGLGSVAGKAQQPVRGLRLIGAADRLRDEIASPVPLILRRRWEQNLEFARKQLTPEAADTAFAEGQAMTWQDAVAYAMEGK